MQGLGLFKINYKISTEKTLSICQDIAKTIYEPICNKLDPYQIGEYNRKINISSKYIQMMNIKSKNLIEPINNDSIDKKAQIII